MPPALPIQKVPQDDILVDLGSRRHKDLPKIYKTKTHPLWNNLEGNIYYFIQDLSKTGMRRSSELERHLHIPHGPEALAQEKGGVLFQVTVLGKVISWCLGFLKLQEGDVVFVRGSNASSTGEEDAVVCWVTGSYVMDHQLCCSVSLMLS